MTLPLALWLVGVGCVVVAAVARQGLVQGVLAAIGFELCAIAILVALLRAI